uniref:Uncharacterized protein n=1 Tax=Arundo donax TaxID=35708 RepID=A0A0A9E539_ARUDO
MMVVSLMHSHSAGSPLAISFSLSGLSLTETSMFSIFAAPPPPPLATSAPSTLYHCTSVSPPIAPISHALLSSLVPLSPLPSSSYAI